LNDRRIGIGIVTWFLGIIVPVYHHTALHAAISQQSTDNIITRLQIIFEYLPWIDWIYLALMFLVGSILIVSGIVNRPPRPAD
jgi:hypothetical protein